MKPSTPFSTTRKLAPWCGSTLAPRCVSIDSTSRQWTLAPTGPSKMERSRLSCLWLMAGPPAVTISTQHRAWPAPAPIDRRGLPASVAADLVAHIDFESRRRQRPAEQMPLHFLAPLLAQEGQLVPGFHAFGDDAQAQAARQLDYRAHDGGVVGVAVEVAHERAVDLQPVDGEALEIAERRVAGAEIVDRQPHAERLQLPHRVEIVFHVLQQDGFG